MRTKCYQIYSEEIEDPANWGSEENLHGKGVSEGISKQGDCQRLLLSAPSFATLTSTCLHLIILSLYHLEGPAPRLPFSFQGLHEVLSIPGNFALLFQATLTFQTGALRSSPLVSWPLHGVRLVFPNHTMSRHHAFFLSNFHVAHPRSGRECFPNGAWGGRYFRLLSFISAICPRAWRSAQAGKPDLLTVKQVVLDKLSPVAGTPHPLSRWSEFPSHLSISKLTFFSKMIMEERCERKRKRSSVPHQLNPPVITAPSDGKDKRAPGTWFLSTPRSSPALSPRTPALPAAPPSLLWICHVPFLPSPGPVPRACSPQPLHMGKVGALGQLWM